MVTFFKSLNQLYDLKISFILTNMHLLRKIFKICRIKICFITIFNIIIMIVRYSEEVNKCLLKELVGISI